jgi:hypothetical protein
MALLALTGRGHMAARLAHRLLAIVTSPASRRQIFVPPSDVAGFAIQSLVLAG